MTLSDPQRWRKVLRGLDTADRWALQARGTWVCHSDTSPPTSSAFVASMMRDRWLLEAPEGVLRLVGDKTRDLTAETGGLRRVPAGAGWQSEPAGLLLRPATWEMGVDAVRDHVLVAGPDHSRLAERDCWLVTLRVPHEDKVPYRLWIDDATGLRLGCETPALRVVLDLLILDRPLHERSDAFMRLLDVVPDIEHAPLPEVPGAARAHVAAVERAAGRGCRVSVLAYPGEGSFSLLIEGGRFVTAVLDRRSIGHGPSYERVFRELHRWGVGMWEYSLDVNEDVAEVHQFAEDLTQALVNE